MPVFVNNFVFIIDNSRSEGVEIRRPLMSGIVGYFLRATPDIFAVIKSFLPNGMELATLSSSDPNEEIEVIAKLDFLIAVRCTGAMFRAARRLRLLQLPGVGYDQVDLAAAREARIPVALSPYGSADAVAEHAILLMLAVCRRLLELGSRVKAGEWPMWDRRLQCRNVQGLTLGIAGMGAIGKEVAARAAALKMDVQCYDLQKLTGYRYVDLEQLLGSSDIVTLHLPLTADTRHFLNRERIRMMKSGAFLVNTARGELIDEQALCDSLASGHLAGAGLDVLAAEPPGPDNPLLKFEQVIVTPHVGTGTRDSLEIKARFYADNIRRVLAGETPQGLL